MHDRIHRSLIAARFTGNLLHLLDTFANGYVIRDMLDRLRIEPPSTIAGLQVLRVVDRLTDQVLDMKTGVVGPMEPIRDPKTGATIDQLTLAKDNLLIFHLAGNRMAEGGLVAIRPSGTEPKCKFYVAANAPVGADATDAVYEKIKNNVDELTVAMKDDAVRYALSLV